MLRCPKESGAYQTEVGQTALTYLVYDPNYADDVAMEEDEEDEVMDADEEDAEEYSDDDDVSWKVLSAAAHLRESCARCSASSAPVLAGATRCGKGPLGAHSFSTRSSVRTVADATPDPHRALPRARREC